MQAFLTARTVQDAQIAECETIWGKANSTHRSYAYWQNINEIRPNIQGADLNFRQNDVLKPRLFLADMDSTMIGQECIDELADFAGVKAEVSAITEAAMQGKLDFEAALRERVKLLEGLPVSVLEQCFSERIAINAGAFELLSALKRNHITCILVSGGFTFFAQKIAQKLGFDEFHANRLEIVDERLTGAVLGEIVNGETKREVLKNHQAKMQVSQEEIIAIGDGANDIPMMQAAGIGIGYHAKPALKAVANITLDYSDLGALLPILNLTNI